MKTLSSEDCKRIINGGYAMCKRVTGYYYCKAVEGSKSHKFECYRKSGKPCYEFERIAEETRNKVFSFYLSRPPKTFSDKARERMDYVITNKHNISGIVIPQGVTSTNPLDANVWYGYGDILPRLKGGGRDELFYQYGEGMLIFRVSKDLKNMEIFILNVRAISESRPQDRPRSYNGKKQNIPRKDILQLFVNGKFWREVTPLRAVADHLKKVQELAKPRQENINFDDDNEQDV